MNEIWKKLMPYVITAAIAFVLGGGAMFGFFKSSEEALRGKIEVLSERNRRIESELVASAAKLESAISRFKKYEEEIERLTGIIRTVTTGITEITTGIDGIEAGIRINTEILTDSLERIRKVQAGFAEDFQFIEQIRKEATSLESANSD